METKDLTFCELSRMWLEDKKSDIKIMSYVRYESIVRNHFDRMFGDVVIRELTSEYVNRCFTKLLNRLEAASVKLIRTVFLQIVDYALDYDFLNKRIKVNYIPLQKKSVKVLTIKESNKLNWNMESSRSLKDLGILLALNTGLRLGEVCALRWRNVDFINRCIHIEGTVQRVPNEDIYSQSRTKLVVRIPKTVESCRDVPVPLFIWKMFRRLRGRDECFLMTNSRTRIPDPRVLETSFQSRCRRYLGRCVNFHCLRHTFASISISCGVDVKVVSEIMGHSDVSTTLRFYRAVDLKEKKQGINTLERLIGPKKNLSSPLFW